MPDRVLVLGATGRVGRHVTSYLLSKGISVLAVTRPGSASPPLTPHANLEVLALDIPSTPPAVLAVHFSACTAAVCALGHSPTLRGIFCPPYYIVRDAVRKVRGALAGEAKFVLLASEGVCDVGDVRGGVERAVLWLLSVLVPPHWDNVCAAREVRGGGGRWVVARPVTFIEGTGGDYLAMEKGKGIFGGDVVDVRTVARFIADLVVEQEIWDRWEGRMPMVKNK